MNFTQDRIQYRLPMKPVPYYRPRVRVVGKGGAARAQMYDHPNYAKFQKTVGGRIAEGYEGFMSGPMFPTERLGIDVEFYVSDRRGDTDNFGKSLIDAIQRSYKDFGVGPFANDSQFDFCCFRRLFVPKDQEGIIATITGVEGNGYNVKGNALRGTYPSPFNCTITL